jgi:hypothetical protein
MKSEKDRSKKHEELVVAERKLKKSKTKASKLEKLIKKAKKDDKDKDVVEYLKDQLTDVFKKMNQRYKKVEKTKKQVSQ